MDCGVQLSRKRKRYTTEEFAPPCKILEPATTPIINCPCYFMAILSDNNLTFLTMKKNPEVVNNKLMTNLREYTWYKNVCSEKMDGQRNS